MYEIRIHAFIRKGRKYVLETNEYICISLSSIAYCIYSMWHGNDNSNTIVKKSHTSIIHIRLKYPKQLKLQLSPPPPPPQKKKKKNIDINYAINSKYIYMYAAWYYTILITFTRGKFNPRRFVRFGCLYGPGRGVKNGGSLPWRWRTSYLWTEVL